MALAADRNTKMMDGGPMPATLSFGVKTGVTIYKGALVGIDTTTGYLVPATAATTICIVGRAEDQVVAGAAASGTYKCNVKTGVHKWANSTVAACAITHVGTMVYAEDDQTISQTSQGGTLSQAGLMLALDSDGGVWVCSGPYPYQGVTYVTTTAAQTLTNKTLTTPVIASAKNMAFYTGYKAVIPLPLNTFVDADGDPIVKFANGGADGFTIVDAKACVYRVNDAASPPAIMTTVVMPADLDDTADVTFCALVSKSGATIGDASKLTVAGYFQTVAAAHDADLNVGGDTNALVGNAAAKTVAKLSYTIAAADVPAAPCSLTLTVKVKDGTLGTDDAFIHSMWLEYTKKVA